MKALFSFERKKMSYSTRVMLAVGKPGGSIHILASSGWGNLPTYLSPNKSCGHCISLRQSRLAIQRHLGTPLTPDSLATYLPSNLYQSISTRCDFLHTVLHLATSEGARIVPMFTKIFTKACMQANHHHPKDIWVTTNSNKAFFRTVCTSRFSSRYGILWL